jgi:hypothetical protein
MSSGGGRLARRRCAALRQAEPADEQAPHDRRRRAGPGDEIRVDVRRDSNGRAHLD